MDKTLKRKIGYVPPKRTLKEPERVTAPAKVKSAPPDPAPSIKASTEPSDKAVKDWIEKHPLFKVSGMCTLIGIHRSNFAKIINHQPPTLPAELKKKMLPIIRKYGFAL